MRQLTAEGHLNRLVTSWVKRDPVSFVYQKISTEVSLDEISRIYNRIFPAAEQYISPLYSTGEWLISMPSKALTVNNLKSMHMALSLENQGTLTGIYSVLESNRLVFKDMLIQRFLETIDVANNTNNIHYLFYIDICMMSIRPLNSQDAEWCKGMRSIASQLWMIDDIERAGFYWYESFNTSGDRVKAMRQIIEALKTPRLQYYYDLALHVSADSNKWNEAKNLFESVREYSNSNPDIYLSIVAEIHLLERFAKSVYNESCDETQFDRDSSWSFLSLVKHLLSQYDIELLMRVEKLLFE